MTVVVFQATQGASASASQEGAEIPAKIQRLPSGARPCQGCWVAPIAPRVWILSAGAVVLYGCIAAWVNQAHGGAAMVRAAMVQGLSSGITTFTMSAVVDASWGWWHRRVGANAALVCSAFGGAGMAAAQHLALNVAAGTKALWATIAIPTLAAVGYSFLYALGARRRHRVSSSVAIDDVVPAQSTPAKG